MLQTGICNTCKKVPKSFDKFLFDSANSKLLTPKKIQPERTNKDEKKIVIVFI